MATELIKKDVDGFEYEFSQFGAKRSLRTLIRLSKVLGKPLSLLLGSMNGSGKLLDKSLDMDMIGLALNALTENMDSAEVISLIEELTSGDACLCDGKKIIFDSHYEGRLDHLFKVLYAALEVQYGNFFGAMVALQGPKKHHPMTQVNPT